MVYEVTSTAILHELLDEEVIIANLDTGSYYSLRGSSVPLWQLLISGQDLKSITSLFAEKFQVDVQEEFHHFIQLLEQEGLLRKALPKQSLLPTNLIWPTEFKAPTFEKYDEMKNLLMLDPIHEVDEQGWPNRS